MLGQYRLGEPGKAAKWCNGFSSIFVDAQTGEPTGRYKRRKLADEIFRIFLELLDALHGILTVKEVVRQFEFNSLRQAVWPGDYPDRFAESARVRRLAAIRVHQRKSILGDSLHM